MNRTQGPASGAAGSLSTAQGKRRPPAWLAALLAAALPACGQGAQGGPEEPRGALLVTLGALRRDALGAYGATPSPTPALDALAAQGVVFEDALAPAPLDLPSHASLMTGLDPRRHGVRDDGAGALGA